MNTFSKRPRLGRGIDALLPQAPSSSSGTGSRDAFKAPVEEVHPSRTQPRRHFDDDALNELAASIKSLGILEPILVRRRSAGGYEIIAGERRWRAAQRAGLHEVPVYVRDLSEREAFEAALVENIQREDLNPIEEARAYQRLVDDFGYTQETLAARVGKDRSTVANAMRLLKLPPEVLSRVESGELTEGHGRAILGAGDVGAMKRLAATAVAKTWSVRETERHARAEAPERAKGGAANAPTKRSANVRDLEDRLTKAIGSRVKVVDKKGRGHLEIPYASYEELDRILAKIL